MIYVLLIVLLGLAFLGVPIAWSLGIASVAAIQYAGIADLSIIAQKTVAGMNSFSMMAIPFFILAGNLMSAGGLTKRLLNIAKAMIGWVRGSVSIVCVVASCFFGAISGSAIATASAIGGMTIPEMINEGYERSYASAVATASAVCGPLIPPSIGLIVYASMTDVPVKDLFVGTLLPGILYGLAICILAYNVAKRRNYLTHPKMPLKAIFKTLVDGFWAMLMPVIILGCIFGGITTPTEASVIAVAYALIVGIFIHKDLKIKDIYKIFIDSALGTAVMFIVIGVSGAVGWIITVSNISSILTEAVVSIGIGKIGVVAFVTLLGLVLGCLMDAVAAILIVTPVALGLVNSCGYSTVEFGVIFTTLMMLGHITPPVGASLLLTNNIAGAKIGNTIREAVPFFLCGLGIVILLWIFPGLITALI